MKLEKLVRVAILALVAMAIMAPAASGDLWWFDHEQGRFPVSTAKKVAKPYLDEMIIKDENGKEITGCVIFVEGEIYSKYGGMGEGTLTKNSEGDECTTTIPECKVTVEPLTSTAWEMTLEEKEKTVTIKNFKLTIKLSGNCKETSLPAESTPTGTIKGEFGDWENPAAAPGRIIFNGKQELTVGGKKIFFDGYIRFGTQVTALQAPKGFTATSSPAEIDGEDVPGEFTVFTRASRTVSCTWTTLTATAKNGDTTISVAPNYLGCIGSFAGLEYPATVKMNGCEYLLHLKSEATGGESYKYTATVDVKCPAGQEIEINVYSSHANHTAGTVTCRFKLGETGNQGLSLIESTNISPAADLAWILAHADVKEIDSKRTSGSILICGPELDTAGTLTGEYMLTGTSDPGEKAIGIAVFP